MKRRFLSFLSILLILCSILTIPTIAAMEPPEEPIDPDPYVKLDMFTASLSINSSGKATCYSYASTATSSYSISMVMSLERYNNGWYTQKTWSGSGTGSTYLDKERYVTHGYYYRVTSTVTVRTSGGSYVESATIHSASKYY